mmetsp:Transcript_22792/g.41287  ORF Transcript_22792/g.41287 Transcript_22792/m.41287 type:complete len:169 (-) Transcript_22792:52-558(-)
MRGGGVPLAAFNPSVPGVEIESRKPSPTLLQRCPSGHRLCAGPRGRGGEATGGGRSSGRGGRGQLALVATFSDAISDCEKDRKWERALSLFDEMCTKGMKPELITYNNVISACDLNGQWQSALTMLDRMREADIKPSVHSLSAVVSACEQAMQYEQAQKLIEEMEWFS